MKNNFRQFLVYDLEVGARKAGAVVPPMRDVITIWQRLSGAGQTHEVLGGDGTMLVGGVEIDDVNDVVVLLVRLSDKSSPNSVYSDPSARTFREHRKTGNQGSDFGCHVIISLTAERNLPNVYTCAVERVPGLSSDLVRRLLSKFLNIEYNQDPDAFTYPDPAGGLNRAGQARTARCCPHIELRGRPSTAFIDDLNRGRLTGITLIKSEPVMPIGGAAYLVKKSSELKLDIDHNSLPANLWNGLRGAFRQNAAAYPAARVTYKLPGGSRQVSVEIDAANGTLLSDAYVLAFDVGNIYPFLAQSAEAIVPHLRDRAIPLLLSHRSI